MIFYLIYCLFWYEVHHNMEVPHTTLSKNAVRKSKGEGAGHGRSSQSNWALLFQTSLTSSIILKFVEEVVECPTFNLLFQSPQKYIQTMQEPKLHISHYEVCENLYPWNLNVRWNKSSTFRTVAVVIALFLWKIVGMEVTWFQMYLGSRGTNSWWISGLLTWVY